MTKKEKIVKAAVEIFAEKGFKSTTTAEIKDRAGVAQGTLFYHFKNKEGILLHIFNDALIDFSERIAAIPVDEITGLEAIIQFMAEDQHFMAEHTLELQILFRELTTIAHNISEDSSFQETWKQPPFILSMLELIERFVRKGMADGSIREMEPEKTTHLLVAIIFGVGRHVVLHVPEAPDIYSLRNQMIVDWLRGEPL